MSEKVTINLEPVDLGRIDVLVEQGLYSNRTDLMKTAIRNQLDRHEPVIEEVVKKKSFVIGAMVLGRSYFERCLEEEKRASLRIIGLLHISSDVDEDLARATIDSISVHGVFRAPDHIKEMFG